LARMYVANRLSLISKASMLRVMLRSLLQRIFVLMESLRCHRPRKRAIQ
jgi:hypothetical protein